MKKLNYFIGLSLLMATVLFTFNSCGDDEDAIGPSLSIDSETDIEVDANSEITISWTSYSGDAKLSTITIARDGSPATDVNGNTWSSIEIDKADNEVYEDEATFDIYSENVTFKVTVTDKDDMTASKSVTVTVKAAAGAINTHAAVTMGSWTASTGSYYASADGNVYKESEVTGHESEIDFVFYVGNTNGATLAAPDDAVLQAGGDLASNYVVNGWSTKNSTKFGSNLSSITWANVTDDTEIVANTSGLTSSSATNLSAGDIIPFVTSAGKKGIIKVDSVDDTYASGNITIAVKVQQ